MLYDKDTKRFQKKETMLGETHYFNIEIAKKYGVGSAIILQNFHFWIGQNKANRKHLYDGKFWTYNTYQALQELFPYYSLDKIKRFIKILKDAEILEVDNTLNKNPYDRTNWYTISVESGLFSHSTDSAYMPDASGTGASRAGTGAHSYTDNKLTDNINTKRSQAEPAHVCSISDDIKETLRESHCADTEKGDRVVERTINSLKAKEEEKKVPREEVFEKWWNLYDKKKGKPAARKLFLKLKESDIEAMRNHTPKYVKLIEKKFRKDPERYLRHECWNDEIVGEDGKPEIKKPVQEFMTARKQQEMYGQLKDQQA